MRRRVKDPANGREMDPANERVKNQVKNPANEREKNQENDRVWDPANDRAKEKAGGRANRRARQRSVTPFAGKRFEWSIFLLTFLGFGILATIQMRILGDYIDCELPLLS